MTESKKALIIDSSGIDPLQFSLFEKHLNVVEVENFFNNANIDLFYSSACQTEFSFQYPTITPSLFVESISVSSQSFSNLVDAIYLSDSGVFSQSSFNVDYPKVASCQALSSESSSTLWQFSPHYNFLSLCDKSIIETAKNLRNSSETVAVLSNDWHLRQQCLGFEGINVYGTCSMLAGMVLSDIISYQKGIFIYYTWAITNARWIPNESKTREKLKFKEIIEIERNRFRGGKSLWMNPNINIV